MKKRLAVIFAFLAIGALLACLVLCGRNKPILVSGSFTSQDVVTIRRDYARLQRQNVRKALVAAKPLFLLTSLRELAFGRVLTVGSPLEGCAVVRTGYVWSTNTVWACDLVRRTNGWCLP
jgi:hypothetical protein